MSGEEVILFPPTHEQSLPTFHVHAELRGIFVEFLVIEGFQIGEPPEDLEGTAITEVLIEAGTPMDKLSEAKAKFSASCAVDTGEFSARYQGIDIRIILTEENHWGFSRTPACSTTLTGDTPSVV